MRRFLSYVGLVDVMDDAFGDPTYRIRLAGTSIEALFGSITGKELNQFLSPALEERWRFVFDKTINAAAPVRFSGRMDIDNNLLHGELLLAPLVDDSNRIVMLFGAVAVRRVSQSKPFPVQCRPPD
jgi:hypothetical protein